MPLPPELGGAMGFNHPAAGDGVRNGISPVSCVTARIRSPRHFSRALFRNYTFRCVPCMGASGSR